MVDTPRRVRLLTDAQSTASEMTRKELSKLHGTAKTTGYRILEAKTTGYRILEAKSACRSERFLNRGRKVLAPFECDAIEAVENANFRFGTASHLANASAIGVAHGSERAIQRNMAEHGVGTYV